MTSIAADQRPVRTLGDATLLGVATVLGLMGYGVASYPASVSRDGLPSLIACAGVLLVYGGAAAWARGRPPGPSRTALGRGAGFGLAIRAVQAANIALENFGDLGPSLGPAVGGGVMGLIVVLFGAAASAAFRLTGSLPLAALAAVWCAIVGTVVPRATRLRDRSRLPAAAGARPVPRPFRPERPRRPAGLRRAEHDRERHRPTCSWPRSWRPSSEPSAGTATAGLRWPGEVAIALAGLVVVQLGLSIAAIRHGLWLERSRRPPYIMTGMLLGGLTLVAAYPVLAAACRPPSPSGGAS